MSKIAPLVFAAGLAALASSSSATTSNQSDGGIVSTAAPVALLFDVQSGQTLFARNADSRFIPASITKVMSALVAFDMIAAGELDTDQTFTFSETAAEEWYRSGSTMFLEPGEEVPVDLLLRGITSVSGNDASVVLAEGAKGSVVQWVDQMNRTAQEIGMTSSHFGTPNGWPDDGRTFTTARDLQRLAQTVITRHPELYAEYFGRPGLSYNGYAQANHDPISGVVEGADGIKTGFTNQAGHGFLGSAERNGSRLIMVVAAIDEESVRADISRKLIEWGFSNFDRKMLFEQGSLVGTARVQNGEANRISLVAADRINFVTRKGAMQPPKLSITYEGPLEAPISQGEQVAHLTISFDGMPPSKVPLLAAEAVGKADAVTRITNAFQNWFN